MKVAIVGTSPHWKDAPFDDPSWEIWSLGRNYTRIPRWNRWFELHRPDQIAKTWEGTEEQKTEAREQYFGWLYTQAKDGRPVYVQADLYPDTFREVVTPFPFDKALAEFERRYFTNSIPWMVALALMEGATEVGIWGVDMALDSEYATQRPSVEYFIGICDGLYKAGKLDAPLHLPDATSLLKTPALYALDPPSPLRQTLLDQKERLTGAKGELEHQKRIAELLLAKHEGGIEMLDHLLLNWGG